MNKFTQMKEMYALKRQADAMKKQMEQITVEVQEGDFTIVMRGDQTVEEISENGEVRTDLKKLFNEAVKESQKKVAKKMKDQLGDFGIPGLS